VQLVEGVDKHEAESFLACVYLLVLYELLPFLATRLIEASLGSDQLVEDHAETVVVFI
jgi:hypothetical protein